MHKGSSNVKRQGKIFIVVGIVLLLALISWAAILLVNKYNTKKSDTVEDNRIIDRSKTIGADKIVSSRQVTAAFEGLAKDITGPQKSGVLVADKNSEGEAVLYSMNMLKKEAPATLQVNKFVYKDAEAVKSNLPFEESRGEAVDGIGDMARFFKFRPVAADWQAVVMVIKGNTIYTFTLIQNHNKGIGITDTAAKQALISLAKDANYQ